MICRTDLITFPKTRMRKVSHSLLKAMMAMMLITALAWPEPAAAEKAGVEPAGSNDETGAGDVPAGYEPAEKDPDKAEMQNDLRRLQKRVRDLEEQIAEIRDRAMDNHPELEDMLRQLVLTRNQVLTEQLARQNLDIQRLEEIDQQLRDPQISAEKKEELQQQQKKLIVAYKKAEVRTAQNKEVRQLREKFYTELMAAAKKENPNAEEMLEEMTRLRHQLQYARPELIDNSS